jgi:RHS repeat-associated protein
MKKVAGGVTTLYLGDDVEITGGVMTKYLPGDAERVGSTAYWIHRDHLSSVRVVTDGIGAVVHRANFRPYGERLVSVPTLPESKAYIGERLDDETGLMYLHARYYDPTLARFLQADPSSPTDAGVGVNRYAYAFNNPVRHGDPSGLATFYVGGLLDHWCSHIIENYERMVSIQNPSSTVGYFTHDEATELTAAINATPPGEPVTIVAQSWAGPTAVQAANMATRPVDVVALLDPVAKDLDPFAAPLDPSKNIKMSVVITVDPKEKYDSSDLTKDVGQFVFGGTGIDLDKASYVFHLQGINHEDAYAMLRKKLDFGLSINTLEDLLHLLHPGPSIASPNSANAGGPSNSTNGPSSGTLSGVGSGGTESPVPYDRSPRFD